MPIFEFKCEKCELLFEEITKFDETDKYPDIKCPECGSKKKKKLVSRCNVAFDDPRVSSKWDSFDYRAGFNLEKAKSERREAEAISKHGSNPYNAIDDANTYGEGMHELI